MKQDVPDVVVRTALWYTQTTTLTDAILALLDVEIKRCADETCQKEFLFQESSGKRSRGKKKPRNDAQFCSNICARRTAQRAYKKRKREKARIDR